MLKSIKSFLFVTCVVMIFTAQTNRPEDKGQQHAPAARPASAARPVAARPAAARPAPAARAPVARNNNQSRPQVQTRRVAPQQVANRQPTVRSFLSQPSRQESAAPRVYAVPASAPVENNRFLNRQHHNKWQPLYNFYNNQYQFYPYVNVTSPVELSAGFVTVLFDGQTYYYDRGRFYQQDDQGRYFAVPPPIGIVVDVLPANARQVNVDGQIYYRYKGVFYVQVAGGYQVVGPVQSPPEAS